VAFAAIGAGLAALVAMLAGTLTFWVGDTAPLACVPAEKKVVSIAEAAVCPVSPPA
jgi:hypothetical protein